MNHFLIVIFFITWWRSLKQIRYRNQFRSFEFENAVCKKWSNIDQFNVILPSFKIVFQSLLTHLDDFDSQKQYIGNNANTKNDGWKDTISKLGNHNMTTKGDCKKQHIPSKSNCKNMKSELIKLIVRNCSNEIYLAYVFQIAFVNLVH